MTGIEELFEKVDEELSDAMEYAEKAMNHKAEHPAKAEMFYSLSLEELKHKNMLMNQIVKDLQTCIEKHPEKEEYLRAMYEMGNKRAIKWENAIRVYQNMFRE